MISCSFPTWCARASMRFLQSCLLVGAIFLFFGQGSIVQAAEGINQQINYQGRLANSNGSIVADGTYSVKFSLYTASSGGTPIWTASGTTGSPTALSVSVVSGLFTVMLGDTTVGGGSQNPLTSLDWNVDNLYLGVTIGADAEMTPRKHLGAVPQAFQAKNATQLQGMSASGTAAVGSTLFTVHQTSSSAATIGSPRSAFDVSTDGLSLTYDFISRFYNSSGTEAVSIRNDGLLSALQTYAYTSTTGATVRGYNIRDKTTGNSWGGSFDSLVIGSFSPEAVTGTLNFPQVIRYDSGYQNALCLDNANTNNTCRFHTGSSLVAEGSVDASAFNTVGFDLAERYRITGEAEPGDLLTIDPDHSMFVQKSPGIAYDQRLVGVVSTQPGVTLGDVGDVSLALSGRVPTKVSVMNGVINVGDVLTSSPVAGVAMKATGPGRTIGYALESATTTSTIEVFIKVGYEAGSFLRTDGTDATTNGNLVISATSTASPDSATVNSWGVTWRGSIWDGLESLRRDFTLLNESVDAAHSLFALKSGTTTLWSVDRSGNMRATGDLTLGGKFFPATRTGSQSEKYLFLDDTGAASSTYIATNADGWQANDSYDFAERYYSPDALTPGDIVLISQRGTFHVQRTMQETDVPIGIVSTRPAFVAGAPATSTYPIALAGRVPTKISTLKGEIRIGDPLAASSLPGVAVKATTAGPIVGYALEAYTGSALGTIEVFVNTGWWGGSAVKEENQVSTVVVDSAEPTMKSYQGVARILAGGAKVKIMHPTLGTFPLIQVTPYGFVEVAWWTDQSTDSGFEILLKKPLDHDVTFSWRAEEMLPTTDKVFLSDGTVANWNVHSGEITYTEPVEPKIEPVTSTTEVVSEPTPTPIPEPSVDPATSTSSLIEEANVATSTAPITTLEPVIIAPTEEASGTATTTEVTESSTTTASL